VFVKLLVRQPPGLPAATHDAVIIIASAYLLADWSCYTTSFLPCTTQVREENERLANKVDELQQQLDTERDNASTALSLMQADRDRVAADRYGLYTSTRMACVLLLFLFRHF